MFKVLVSLVFLASSTQVWAVLPIEQEALEIANVIEINYGPLDLKKTTVGLDWATRKAAFIQEMKSAKNSREVYETIQKLFASLQDAHVSTIVPETQAIQFGIQFRAVANKTLLNFIGKGYAKLNCIWAIGDELIAIDGTPIADIYASMSKFVNVGNARSTQALQAYQLSKWNARNQLIRRKKLTGSLIPATFTFRSQASQARFDCDVPGVLTGSPVLEFPIDPSASSAVVAAAARAELLKFLEKQTMSKKANANRVADADQEINQLALSKEGKALLKSAARILNAQDRMIHPVLPEFEEELALETEVDAEAADGKLLKIGQKKPFFALPRNFKRKNNGWQSLPIIGKPFNRISGVYAGVFKRGNQKIGFVRIPSYIPNLGGAGIIFTDLSLRALFGQLEKQTDLLIIDQTHNPGGAVVYSDWLTSILVGDLDSSKHMKFSIRPRGDWMNNYASIAGELVKVTMKELIAKSGQSKMPKASELFLRDSYIQDAFAEYERVYAAYTKGEFLSQPVALSTISEYTRDLIASAFMKIEDGNKRKLLGAVLNGLYPVHGGKAFTRGQVYTKPVYMMIDELDFSGGDATPALLQDYGRVKLVGVNTAGAGGTVEQFEHGGIFPFNFSLTTSLMVRPGGRTVENVGVKPDLAFELTEADVSDSYATVFERFLTTIGL
ncbi:MAG: hypothetical protein JNL01_12540 [Bdellovibrionales bacterium]|nr:hypothetical protein [Bdellovibrionales bacterium]